MNWFQTREYRMIDNTRKKPYKDRQDIFVIKVTVPGEITSDSLRRYVEDAIKSHRFSDGNAVSLSDPYAKIDDTKIIVRKI